MSRNSSIDKRYSYIARGRARPRPLNNKRKLLDAYLGKGNKRPSISNVSHQEADEGDYDYVDYEQEGYFFVGGVLENNEPPPEVPDDEEEEEFSLVDEDDEEIVDADDEEDDDNEEEDEEEKDEEDQQEQKAEDVQDDSDDERLPQNILEEMLNYEYPRVALGFDINTVVDSMIHRRKCSDLWKQHDEDPLVCEGGQMTRAEFAGRFKSVCQRTRISPAARDELMELLVDAFHHHPEINLPVRVTQRNFVRSDVDAFDAANGMDTVLSLHLCPRGIAIFTVSNWLL